MLAQQIVAFLVIATLFVNETASGGVCRTGKVTAIMEGGWNTDNPFVRKDGIINPGSYGDESYYHHGWIRFCANDSTTEKPCEIVLSKSRFVFSKIEDGTVY